MKERPISFGAPALDSILAGRKTQLRRPVTKKTSRIGSLPRSEWSKLRLTEPVVSEYDGKVRNTFVDDGGRGNLWCAIEGQQYLHVPHEDGDTVHRIHCLTRVGHRLRVKEASGIDDAHRTSAPAIVLVVESVRAQRLQDVSDEDARAEGAEPETFRARWDAKHGATGLLAWAANPWVWAIRFRVER